MYTNDGNGKAVELLKTILLNIFLTIIIMSTLEIKIK